MCQRTIKKQARWLYEQGLPVTAENIVKMNRIQELTQLDSGTLLARITDQMADGVLPGQADLMVPSREEAAEMAEGLFDNYRRGIVKGICDRG